MYASILVAKRILFKKYTHTYVYVYIYAHLAYL